MTTPFRLHLVRSAPAADLFADLYAAYALTAADLLGQRVTTTDAAWEFAQFIDLADAGYGDPTGDLYLAAMGCLVAYVVDAHRDNLLDSAMCGRSAILAQLAGALLELPLEPNVLKAA